MANADFSRQQNQPTGGFDASSYRAAAPAEEEVRLTPFQQKLASLEKALPAALSKQAVAVALCIVVAGVLCRLWRGEAPGKVRHGEERVHHWRGRRQRLYPE